MQRNKRILILATILVSILIAGIVSVANGANVNVLPKNDSLLGKYEKSERIFKKSEIGDKIVYFHQRKMQGAIVEKDYILYQFKKDTNKVKKQIESSNFVRKMKIDSVLNK